MLQENVEALLARLTPSDLVLDVGGWACPFNRAQWVLDAEPYETRGFYRTFGAPASQGPAEEWFTRETWVQRDICDRSPWPFADKQFDFAVCSHTLEDLRDPVGVCDELQRVARRGYIEVPSREWESCRGLERPRQAGLSHHRWLVEIRGSTVSFLPKYHMINADWRFSLPASHAGTLDARASVAWLWWNDRFDCREVTIHGLAAQEAALQEFARSIVPQPGWLLALDRAYRAVTALPARAMRSLRRSAAPPL
ncbi:MAG: methyltransferase domain-containing protein [Gemmatimonadales bacterium]